jgi:hypothetical protein
MDRRVCKRQDCKKTFQPTRRTHVYCSSACQPGRCGVARQRHKKTFPEKYQEYDRRYRASHPEKIREKNRLYYAQHAQQERERSRRRRAAGQL